MVLLENKCSLSGMDNLNFLYSQVVGMQDARSHLVKLSLPNCSLICHFRKYFIELKSKLSDVQFIARIL